MLRKHGLTKSGAYFVLASEAEILEKFDKVRPLIASMAQPFNMFAQALRNDMMLADAEEYYNEMRLSVDAAIAMLSKMPNGKRANSQEKQDFQQAEAIRDERIRERDSSSGVVDAWRAQQYRSGARRSL